MVKFNKEPILNWLRDPRNRVLSIAVVFMLVIVIAVQLNSTSGSQPSNADESTTDTYIPEGYVLVPIELQNADSLSSLIGNFAIVDLFRGPHSQRVGRRLKILRAPLNPQQFAVLVPEGEVQKLLQNPGSFWAAIQNPNLKKSEELASRNKKSRIEYFQGE